jgi:hypothetical protein
MLRNFSLFVIRGRHSGAGSRRREMIHLDRTLLHHARKFITAANIHRVTTLMVAYEFAVSLHNDGLHEVYQGTFERELRHFVHRELRRITLEDPFEAKRK